MREQIAVAKQEIKDASDRHTEAAKDVKRIGKDMSEFSNNKDSKLAELEKSLEKLKKEWTKNSAAIKPLQQELREAKLDSEQCGGDLAAVRESLEEVETSLKTLREEIANLKTEHSKLKVSTARILKVFDPG